MSKILTNLYVASVEETYKDEVLSNLSSVCANNSMKEVS